MGTYATLPSLVCVLPDECKWPAAFPIEDAINPVEEQQSEGVYEYVMVSSRDAKQKLKFFLLRSTETPEAGGNAGKKAKKGKKKRSRVPMLHRMDIVRV